MENWEEKSLEGNILHDLKIDNMYHFEFDPADLHKMGVTLENQIIQVNKVVLRYISEFWKINI